MRLQLGVDGLTAVPEGALPSESDASPLEAQKMEKQQMEKQLGLQALPPIASSATVLGSPAAARQQVWYTLWEVMLV